MERDEKLIEAVKDLLKMHKYARGDYQDRSFIQGKIYERIWQQKGEENANAVILMNEMVGQSMKIFEKLPEKIFKMVGDPNAFCLGYFSEETEALLIEFLKEQGEE